MVRAVKHLLFLGLLTLGLASSATAQSSWGYASTPAAEPEPENALVESFKENKETILRAGGGAVAGFVTAKVAKSMMKVAVITGIVAYGVLHTGIALPSAAMKELHLGDAKTALEEKTRNIFDINNDGVLNNDDITAGKDKLQSFISTHIPLSGGFAAGFAAGL